jgi:hypothetical protein
LLKVPSDDKYSKISNGYVIFAPTVANDTVRDCQRVDNVHVVTLELVRVVRRLLQARRALRVKTVIRHGAVSLARFLWCKALEIQESHERKRIENYG